jgi:hypothetical protein
MNLKLSENKLKKIVQGQIDSALILMRHESEDWGLGEMDELYEIDSIDKIVVDRIVTQEHFEVYVDIYQNKKRHDYDNTLAEIEYSLEDIFPNVVIHINEIIPNEF